MDKTKLVTMAKNDMNKIIERLLLENIPVIKEEISHYFNYLETIPYLNDENETEIKSDSKEDSKEETKVEETQEARHSFSESETQNEEEKVYRFERKLRGGFIGEIQAFIPEGIVRRLDLEHGDYVKAKQMINHEDANNDKKYFYELVKKGEGKPAENRIELKYCLVEKDGNMLVINKSLLDGGQSVRIGEVPYSFLLRNEEIIEFGLKEGDIVDIAYLSTSPEYSKVIWKHSMEQDDYTTPQISGYYKTKMKIDKNEIINKTLKGKKILVIGCEPRKTVFKQNIEERGGEFFWADGLEGKTRLRSMIQKVDAVVILIRFIRHRASLDTVEICKELNVPFAPVENLGVQTLLMEAENVISA